MTFDTIEQVKEWIINNQLARRNLTDEKRSYLLGSKRKQTKQKHGGQKRAKKGSITVILPSDAKTKTNDSAQKLADEHGVSRQTVINAEKFADAVDAIGQTDPQAKQAILTGQSNMTQKQVIQATKPKRLLCPNCQRKGPRSFCRDCYALNSGDQPKKHTKKPKLGKALDLLNKAVCVRDWNLVEDAITIIDQSLEVV